jgi:hypothetical protein
MRLAVALDMVRPEPRHGHVQRGCVSMNSDLGLLWVNAVYGVGERAIFEQAVLVHSLDLRGLADGILAPASGENGNARFCLGSSGGRVRSGCGPASAPPDTYGASPTDSMARCRTAAAADGSPAP